MKVVDRKQLMWSKHNWAYREWKLNIVLDIMVLYKLQSTLEQNNVYANVVQHFYHHYQDEQP